MTHGLRWQAISGQAEADTVEPLAGVAALRPEPHAGKSQRPLGMNRGHRSVPRITRQQVVARKMRLAAKIDGVAEPLRASREPLVAPFGNLDRRADLDLSGRRTAQCQP